jgi:hypothetical protein
MSVDTKGILLGRFSAQEIANILSENLYEVKSIDFGVYLDSDNPKNFWWVKDDYINIIDSACSINPKRRMQVFQSDKNRDYLTITKENDITILTLGCFGNSVGIIKSVVMKTGGWLLENDCDDNWIFLERVLD